MGRVYYEIENRQVIMEQVAAEGKMVAYDNITDLDENGRPTNCFVDVVDVTPDEGDETADLLEAAAIMGLEPEEE